MTNYQKNFAIILAAGKSTRMGACKTSLPWYNNQTLLQYQVTEFLKADFIPIVVLSPQNAASQPNLPSETQIIINPNPELGKTSSILTGLTQIPQDFTTLAISAVDQPRPREVYQKLGYFHLLNKALITAPTYSDRIGHPLLFSPEMLPYLNSISEATQGLRQIVKQFNSSIQKVEFNHPIVLADLNTPEHYQTWFSSHLSSVISHL
ncbi:NTP transferase domain-containing protein [Aerosakkonemataceae cyanobacterium BLCC-F50]|uniref:NTP transferase domain-containing protein n=1 Tax=Floridaenema flaviceps BLCC-F50 TaxID=3153642 RepID=A0ABV4XSA0_9CYAN